MRRLLMKTCIVVAAVALMPGLALGADQTVEEFEAAQQAAWNAHDAAAYAAAFAPDADIITSVGWHWTGDAEVARNLGDGFKLVYAHARLQLSEPKVRVLTQDLAAVALTWTIEGARTIEGGQAAGEQHGIQTQLLQRRGGRWSIVSQQDTMTTMAPAAPVPQPAEAAAPAVTAFPTTPPPVRRCILARGNGDCLIYGKPRPAPTR